LRTRDDGRALRTVASTGYSAIQMTTMTCVPASSGVVSVDPAWFADAVARVEVVKS